MTAESNSRRQRRAGFSLIEIVIVVAFVAVFMTLIFGAVFASAIVQRDTITESEVVAFASKTMDTVSRELVQAGQINQCAGFGAEGTQIEWYHVNYVDDDPLLAMRPLLGARLPTGVFQRFWKVRALWVEDTSAAHPSPWNETVLGVDLNGNGNATDTAVRVGHLELRYFSDDDEDVNDVGDPTPPTEVPAFRQVIGGGPVKIVRDAFGGSTATPVRMFARPPLTNPATGVDEPRLGLGSYIGATAFRGQSEETANPDRGVLLMLRFVSTPTPNAQGRPEVSIYEARRLITPR